MSRIVLTWRKGSPKAVDCEVSLDGPTHKGVSCDRDKGSLSEIGEAK